MLRRLAYSQTRQFPRSFHNLPFNRLGHQQWQIRLYHPVEFGVTQLPYQRGHRNVVVSRGGQVAGFHSTRRNEGLHVMPLFAAMLKVRLSRARAFAGANIVFVGVRFHGTRSDREQGSAIFGPSAPPQEPQIEKMAT